MSDYITLTGFKGYLSAKIHSIEDEDTPQRYYIRTNGHEAPKEAIYHRYSLITKEEFLFYLDRVLAQSLGTESMVNKSMPTYDDLVQIIKKLAVNTTITSCAG